MEYTYKNLVKNKDEHKYEVKVEFKELIPFQDEAYKVLSKDVKIEGFRPGMAPRKMIESKLGSKVLVEAINRLLPAVTLEIAEKEGLKPVTAPNYDLQTTDPKEGIIFTFSVVNYPEVTLGDFKKIKVKKKKPSITQKEVDEVIRSIIKSSLKPEKIKELTKAKEQKSEKAKESNSDKAKKHKSKKEDKAEVQEFELNDKLVKELGYEEEKTLKSLRESVKRRLEEVKEKEAAEKYTDEVLQEAVKLSKFDIPELFIERETENMEKQFMSRLEELKLDADTYLKTQGSSLEEKKKEWKKDAKKKVEIDILLVNIADQMDSVASDDDVAEEIEKIQDKKVRDEYKESDNAKEYVRSVITKQRGLAKLMEEVGE